MNKVINRIGYLSGIIAFCAAVAYCLVQLFQLYAVTSYPVDEILIYGTSLLIVLPFLIEMLSLHYIVPKEKKFWSHGALIFATLYVVFVSANYIVQLTTVIPMTLKGRLDEVRVFQQTPHSLFWDFDGLGYIFMGLATAMAIPIFRKEGIEKWVRVAFISNAIATPLITIVYFYPVFSIRLLLLGFLWGVTAPLSMLLLAFVFKRNIRRRKAKSKSEGLSFAELDDDDAEDY
jgi:hypothetical protein